MSARVASGGLALRSAALDLALAACGPTGLALFGFLVLTPRLCSCDLVDVFSGESSADAAALELGDDGAADLNNDGFAERKRACDDWSLFLTPPFCLERCVAWVRDGTDLPGLLCSRSDRGFVLFGALTARTRADTRPL